MVLMLEISGPEAAKLGGTSRKVFNARGGTIGRVVTNDWVLPDGYVSSRHARIQDQDDTYYLIDESKNGVCINSPDNHLEPGRPYVLQTGDWILIDPYEIHVSIAEEETAREMPALSRPLDTPPQRPVPSPIDPFAADTPSGDYPRPRPSSGGSSDAAVGFDLLPAEEVDPLSLLGGSSRAPAYDTPRAADSGGRLRHQRALPCAGDSRAASGTTTGGSDPGRLRPAGRRRPIGRSFRRAAGARAAAPASAGATVSASTRSDPSEGE